MTTVLIVAVVSVAALLAASVFAIAWRRGPSQSAGAPAAPDARPGTDRRVLAAAGEARAEAGEEEAPVDPLEARRELDREDYDVTRRQFFNRGIYGVFGLFLAQFGVAGLAFMWPRLQSGGFGSKVNAGPVDTIRDQLFLPDGRVQPLFVPPAQAYILPWTAETVEGSSFEGLPVIAGGVMAVWQRCVHLGCRVPECQSSQGFECPCHGSKYNYHGEYEDGPAPRNLDHFVVTIDDAGGLVIDTGQIIQTARATHKTAEYPQGPSCI
jgi:cytochrome b6-f complex iron-sulfur subunit